MQSLIHRYILSQYSAAATVIHFWRTEGKELLHLCVTKYYPAFESIATHV